MNNRLNEFDIMDHNFKMNPLDIETFPEVRWVHGDDLCNCTFQRIGEWTNPYLGKTLIIRQCCIWEKLLQDHPEFVQEVNGYWSDNLQEYIPHAFEWTGEDDMPRSLWYRQLAHRENKDIEQIRDEYRLQDPPKGIPRKKEKLKTNNEYIRTLRTSGGTTGQRTGGTYSNSYASNGA